MSTHDPESLATAWLEHQKHWWAYEALDGLVASSPSEALEVVTRLVDRAENHAMLEAIGAGPLEDLIHYHREPPRVFRRAPGLSQAAIGS